MKGKAFLLNPVHHVVVVVKVKKKEKIYSIQRYLQTFTGRLSFYLWGR